MYRPSFLPPGATRLVVPPGHIGSATQAINIARVLGLNAVTSLPRPSNAAIWE